MTPGVGLKQQINATHRIQLLAHFPMPKQSDEAIKFLTEELRSKRLDPRADSSDVIELYKSIPIVGSQLLEYVATAKAKTNWVTYWSRLRKEYLNKYENLNPARDGLGPEPCKYPNRSERYKGDTKGTQEADEAKPAPRPKSTLAPTSPPPRTPSRSSNMSSETVPTGLVSLPQTSNTEMRLDNKAICWEDSTLNKHIQCIAWLPSGIMYDSIDPEVKVDRVTLRFARGQLLHSASQFEDIYKGAMQFLDGKRPDSNTTLMFNENRRACTEISEMTAAADIVSIRRSSH
jgi:hypothetical protein